MRRENIVFRALADPSRRAILERHTRGEAAVKDLTARFAISQPAASQHPGTLRRAGLVSECREGHLVYYRVDPRGLRPIFEDHALWGLLARAPRPTPRVTGGVGPMTAKADTQSISQQSYEPLDRGNMTCGLWTLDVRDRKIGPQYPGISVAVRSSGEDLGDP